MDTNNLRKCIRCSTQTPPPYTRCPACREKAKEDTKERRKRNLAQPEGAVDVPTIFHKVLMTTASKGQKNPMAPHPRAGRQAETISFGAHENTNPVFTTVGTAAVIARKQEESREQEGKQVSMTPVIPSMNEQGLQAFFEHLRAAGVIGCLLLAEDLPRGVQIHTYGDHLAGRTLLPVFQKLTSGEMQIDDTPPSSSPLTIMANASSIPPDSQTERKQVQPTSGEGQENMRESERRKAEGKRKRRTGGEEVGEGAREKQPPHKKSKLTSNRTSLEDKWLGPGPSAPLRPQRKGTNNENDIYFHPGFSITNPSSPILPMAKTAFATKSKAATQIAKVVTKKSDAERKRPVSKYNLFVAANLAKWKEENPGRSTAALAAVAQLWAESDENPNKGKPVKKRVLEGAKINVPRKVNGGHRWPPVVTGGHWWPSPDVPILPLPPNTSGVHRKSSAFKAEVFVIWCKSKIILGTLYRWCNRIVEYNNKSCRKSRLHKIGNMFTISSPNISVDTLPIACPMYLLQRT
ncbi:hypothetical protein B0H12DRAFT_1067199 [Mycena haematopus]|nr:hypothetical protein B0H12DRAFT_1067199 [Mycena haematopus]